MPTGPTPARPPALTPGAARARQIAIVGAGYVGLVTGACLAELGNSVVCVDNDAAKIATLRRNELPFFEPDLAELAARNVRAGRLEFSQDARTAVRAAEIVFIAVGTPSQADDCADLSAIWDVAATIGQDLNAPKIVVLKSTVPIGTCERVSAIIAEHALTKSHVDVVSNPEFLREGCAVADFMHADRVVIGTSCPHAEAVMRELYAPLDAPFLVADLRTSEMIKYASNAFLAAKISMINEIANVCELVGVDVTVVRDGMALDPRIEGSFLGAGIGFGGSCFPKDLRALERIAEAGGYDAALLRAVDSVNRGQIGRTLSTLEMALGGSVAGKVVCVLGLAFKPNTSDVRESPALRLIESLLQAGATVKAHDPVATPGARAELNDAKVGYCSDKYDAVRDSDALVLTTEWDEYRDLDFAVVAESMRGDLVFDGRNIFDADTVSSHDLRYLGVGRPEAAGDGVVLRSALG
ncbi:MAG: UDP-glucose/GDP-mannose dehydrogenase family protein [Candidatus Tumulicola sp.]